MKPITEEIAFYIMFAYVEGNGQDPRIAYHEAVNTIAVEDGERQPTFNEVVTYFNDRLKELTAIKQPIVAEWDEMQYIKDILKACNEQAAAQNVSNESFMIDWLTF